jgi:hypothetical protein
MQVALEANTWIKSNQSLLFIVVRLLKNLFLNLVRMMMSQSLRVRKGLNLNIAKKRLIPPTLPFPHAMTKQRKVNHNSEIFETFNQVRINIPLLDAIKQVPSYAKFLKDLCTVKRKLNVKKKAFLAEQVSVIL